MFLPATNIKPIRKLNHLDVKPLNGKKGKDGKDGIDAPTAKILIPQILSRIPAPKDGKNGDDGKDAPSIDSIISSLLPHVKHGRDGKNPPTIKQIISKIKPFIPKAIHGEAGEDGEAPAHEIDKKRLRIKFKNPDGDWGEWLELGKELSKLMSRQIGVVNRGGSDPGKTPTVTIFNEAYNINTNNHMVFLNGLNNDIVATLPDAQFQQGREFIVMRLGNDSNSVHINSLGGAINNFNAVSFAENLSITIRSDGANWWITSSSKDIGNITFVSNLLFANGDNFLFNNGDQFITLEQG